MGYVAIKGGERAIQNAERLVDGVARHDHDRIVAEAKGDEGQAALQRQASELPRRRRISQRRTLLDLQHRPLARPTCP